MISAVPGVVSDLTGQPKFTIAVLTWSAPQELNGVIISYEVTYRVSNGNLTRTNTTDLSTTFTISSLTPGTNVTDISVSAYTSIGRGESVLIPILMTLTAPCKFKILFEHFSFLPVAIIVMNVIVAVLSDTSVQVSWDRLDAPEVKGYIVYYSQTGSSEMVTAEQSVNISNSNASVIIDNLINSTLYQFEVVAVAELNGDVVLGQRSPTSSTIVLPSSLFCTATESMSVYTMHFNSRT